MLRSFLYWLHSCYNSGIELESGSTRWMRQKYVVLIYFCVLGVPNALDVWRHNSNLYVCRLRTVTGWLLRQCIKQYLEYCLWFSSLSFRLNKHLIRVKKRAIRILRTADLKTFSFFLLQVFFIFKGCLGALWKKRGSVKDMYNLSLFLHCSHMPMYESYIITDLYRRGYSTS